MILSIIKFLLAIILSEAITELVTKSEIFEPLRAKIYRLGKGNTFFSWFHRLLDCGYCFSVWTGMLIAVLFFRDTHFFHEGVDWFLIGIILHRLSNLFHNFMDRVHGIDKL